MLLKVTTESKLLVLIFRDLFLVTPLQAIVFSDSSTDIAGVCGTCGWCDKDGWERAECALQQTEVRRVHGRVL